MALKKTLISLSLAARQNGRAGKEAQQKTITSPSIWRKNSPWLNAMRKASKPAAILLNANASTRHLRQIPNPKQHRPIHGHRTRHRDIPRRGCYEPSQPTLPLPTPNRQYANQPALGDESIERVKTSAGRRVGRASE